MRASKNQLHLLEAAPYVAGVLAVSAIGGYVREIPWLLLGAIVLLVFVIGATSAAGRNYPWRSLDYGNPPRSGEEWHQRAITEFDEAIGRKLIRTYNLLVGSLLVAVLMGGLAVMLAGLLPRYLLLVTALVLSIMEVATLQGTRAIMDVVSGTRRTDPI